ncbi:hypothetical protein PP459_gp220 [Streptomyces phage Wakanda]|uniref:Uncharacterized protein n=2 Tax=Wakandavirus TaxID=3044854 RepID=A0A6G8R3P4_9CAUD|nr:hypothetical protein PP459_gp220 [Streptomyces phage Wakanda]YP_010652332.1 hypothetical protein PP460_gp226 [Streptomyces phage Muntaha]QIN94014.1 hypothetical protein SEA_WAKANDA_21 [Streptomyces phage Wakanda]QIN94578.1 hypothetical protein SEA_MUNTAHA_21 [Streptomyces phage Muntaha]
MYSLLKRAWRGLVREIHRPINRVAAGTLSIYTMLWGLWLSNPFWEVFSQGKLYGWLGSVADETVWGLLALGVGAVMTYGVVKASPKSLTIGAFVGFLHWLLIAIGYFAGNWMNTGGITSVAMAIYCAAIYLNLRVVNHNLAFEKDSDII